MADGSAVQQNILFTYSLLLIALCSTVSLSGPQSVKTDLRVKIFKIVFFCGQNSSLDLVDDAQSENIGEKREYRP